MDIVRVSATGAGVNYFPEFIARELGFFADEGLEAKVEVLGNGPGVPRDVGSGAADVGLGGIWLPMLYRGRLHTFIPFAQLCNRLATNDDGGGFETFAARVARADNVSVNLLSVDRHGSEATVDFSTTSGDDRSVKYTLRLLHEDGDWRPCGLV